LATGSELAGQDGWEVFNIEGNSSTREDGNPIAERDGNKFLDGFAAGGDYVTLIRPLNMFSGTGFDRVEMTWTAKMGYGDYPVDGNERSTNTGIGFHASSKGTQCCGLTIFQSSTVPDEGDPSGTLSFENRYVGGTGQIVPADDAYGQETGMKLFLDRSTGEIGGGFDAGLTGSYTLFDSIFVDPGEIALFDGIRIFLDNRGGDGYEVDNIVVTPEPASLALIGIGGLALLMRNRRRR